MNIDYLIAEKWSGQNRSSRTGSAALALMSHAKKIAYSMVLFYSYSLARFKTNPIWNKVIGASKETSSRTLL